MIKINKEKNMGKLCWPNTGRGEAHIPGALHCRSSTCLNTYRDPIKHKPRREKQAENTNMAQLSPSLSTF